MNTKEAISNFLNYLSNKYYQGVEDIKILAGIVSNIESSIKGYKNYRCLFNQVGTSAPTVTVLLNELGTVTWQRIGIGEYNATITEPLPIGKVFVNDNYVAYDPTLFGPQALLKITYVAGLPNVYIQCVQHISNKITLLLYDNLDINLAFTTDYGSSENFLIDIKVYS